MENTNKKEPPRNRPKEDMIPCQPSPNDSKDFMTNPLKKNKKQFSEEDNQNIVQNEISSQRKITNQFKTYRHLSNEQDSQYFIKRGKNPSLRFIKGLNSLDWTLYEGFSQDFKHIPQIKALCALKLSLVNDFLTSKKGISSIKDIKKLKYLRNMQANCSHLNRNAHELINFLFTSLKHCSNN